MLRKILQTVETVLVPRICWGCDHYLTGDDRICSPCKATFALSCDPSLLRTSHAQIPLYAYAWDEGVFATMLKLASHNDCAQADIGYLIATASQMPWTIVECVIDMTPCTTKTRRHTVPVLEDAIVIAANMHDCRLFSGKHLFICTDEQWQVRESYRKVIAGKTIGLWDTVCDNPDMLTKASHALLQAGAQAIVGLFAVRTLH